MPSYAQSSPVDLRDLLCAVDYLEFMEISGESGDISSEYGIPDRVYAEPVKGDPVKVSRRQNRAAGVKVSRYRSTLEG